MKTLVLATIYTLLVAYVYGNCIPESSDGGCIYKGKYYPAGASWIDGCDFNCTCTNGYKGLYSCSVLCPYYESLPEECVLEKAEGECCAKPVCSYGDSSGTQQSKCVYKGVRYEQDEEFKDGCDYKCKCSDAVNGQISCSSMCMNWSNLPEVCTLDPPPEGKCCPVPNCPSSIQLQYPPGFVFE